MEDIDGGLHPAVDGQSLDDDDEDDDIFKLFLKGSVAPVIPHVATVSNRFLFEP